MVSAETQNLPTPAKRPWLGIFYSVVLVGLHGIGWSGKVREVTPDRFARHACPIETSSRWSYGYILEYHGAILVKARTTGPFVPRVETFQNADGSVDTFDGCSGSALLPVMARDLRLITPRALGELGLYLGLIVWGLWGSRKLRERLAIGTRSAAWRLPYAAASWMLPWTAFLLPLLVARYGAPLWGYTQGPGPMGATFYRGEAHGYPVSITYGPLVGISFLIACLPLIAVEQVAPAAVTGSYLESWLSGLLTFGVLGMGREQFRAYRARLPVSSSRPDGG